MSRVPEDHGIVSVPGGIAQDLLSFFDFFSARFSFIVFAGFFFVSFLVSVLLLMMSSP